MTLECGFEDNRAWRISVFIEVFYSGAMFLTDLSDFTFFKLFIENKGPRKGHALILP